MSAKSAAIGAACLVMMLAAIGCAPSKPAPSLSSAIRSGDAGARVASTAPPGPALGTVTDQEAIATIDGRPLNRQVIVDILLRSHGPTLFEQLIVLQSAETIAAERGRRVTDADYDREYERMLRRLTDPLTAITGEAYNRMAAEEVLRQVLADRNVSMEEYVIAVRRTAALRQVAESRVQISEDDLRAEYARIHGERAEVRHIQLGSPIEIERVLDRLTAGEEFGRLARLHSANSAGALQDGLLLPFSRYDEAVPQPFREAAFGLEPGQVSEPLRMGSWYHLIRLERFLPPDDVSMEEVRPVLERRLLERLAEPEMQRLHERLFREAQVRIHDPVLRAAFEARYGNPGG